MKLMKWIGKNKKATLIGVVALIVLIAAMTYLSPTESVGVDIPCTVNADCPNPLKNSDTSGNLWSNGWCIEDYGNCQYETCLDCRGDEWECDFLYCAGCDCYFGDPILYPSCQVGGVAKCQVTTTTLQVQCDSREYYKCYQGAVWWFNSCDVPESVRETCYSGCYGDSCTPPTTTTSTIGTTTTSTIDPGCSPTVCTQLGCLPGQPYKCYKDSRDCFFKLRDEACISSTTTTTTIPGNETCTTDDECESGQTCVDSKCTSGTPWLLIIVVIVIILIVVKLARDQR